MWRLTLSRLALFGIFSTLATATSLAQAQQAPGPVAPGGAPGVPPEQQQALVDQALDEWFKSSKQVQSLVGEHRRFVYDFVFNVEKRAEGKFFYTSPDKGRIDLLPTRVDLNTQNKKLNPVDQKPVTLNVQSDISTQWICDGQQILVVDNVERSVQQFKIPKQAQGENIMDGPLPFLFGMPPEKAKARYSLRILKMDKTDIDLVVIPKWQSDAANYQWARVRLERSTMLPKAVQMVDPAGTRETVYTFPTITKNPATGGVFDRLKFWKEKDPFKPDFKGYEFHSADEGPLVEGPAQKPGGKAVPSVVGFDFKQAEELLKKSGFDVKFKRGQAAPQKELIYRVQTQNPAPKSVTEPGNIVWLTLYTAQVEQTGGEENKIDGVPTLTGLFWKDAQKQVESAGLAVKFVPGKVATNEADIFKVYEQIPAAGVPLKAGESIILKLYNRPGVKQ